MQLDCLTVAKHFAADWAQCGKHGKPLQATYSKQTKSKNQDHSEKRSYCEIPRKVALDALEAALTAWFILVLSARCLGH